MAKTPARKQLALQNTSYLCVPDSIYNRSQEICLLQIFQRIFDGPSSSSCKRNKRWIHRHDEQDLFFLF